MIVASVYLLVVAHEIRGRRSALAVLEPYEIGERFIDFAGKERFASERLLLMWIQSTCPYCTKSMPLYQRLAQDATRTVRMIAIGPESEEIIRAYLDEHRVEVDHVVTAPEGVRLYSTPTLLLVEPDLTISKIWIGRLSDGEEEQVAVTLRGAAPSR